MKGTWIIALLISFSAVGQGVVDRIYPMSLSLLENRTLQQHSGILPAIRQSAGLKVIDEIDGVFKPVDHFFRVRFSPDLASQYDTSLFYRAAVGFTVESLYKNKLYTRTLITSGWSNQEGVNQTHVAFSPLHESDLFNYTNIRTRIAYTPNKYLHIAAGIDNQFFGEGHRSLIQSDQAAPNPFAMMRVNVWRFEYGLLYQFFHENHPGSRFWKFGATHYLSYNVTKRFNIGFFETVLFQPKDGNFNRAFEVEYLNPLVFFRPQEYSIGSSDNVLLGLQMSYSFKKHTIYGQALLDEFVLKEIRARSQWWANKYGAQLGIKGKIKNISYRVEANLMRPYTFSHINDGQNGGNQGRSIAHPLGSNFAELLAQVNLPIGKGFYCTAYTVFQLKGLDEDSLSWGGDIYQSYNTRPQEYDNTIGQGITQRSFRVGCQISYSLPNLESTLYIDPQIALHWGDLPSVVTPAITVGWRSNLFQNRRLF